MKWLALTMAAGAIFAGNAWARYTLQADPQRFALKGVREMRLDFPVGELTVEGDDGDDIRLDVRIRCDEGNDERCEERARTVTIEHTLQAGVLNLEFRGMPKMNTHGVSIKAHLLVPRTLAANIQMGVGELDVTDLASNVTVELGVGDLQIRGDTSDFAAVHADVGVGDASLRTRNDRVQGRGFIGRDLHWDDGRGPSHVHAHVGVGDVNVVLR